jgi:hypothetical protein
MGPVPYSTQLIAYVYHIGCCAVHGHQSHRLARRNQSMEIHLRKSLLFRTTDCDQWPVAEGFFRESQA